MHGMVAGSKLGITVVVLCAAVMAMLDVTIVNVGLSDIRASFGAPLDQIGWVSTGYMIANVVIIPMTGWFQRRLGFRRYFATSILLFTVASALCSMAWSLPSLVLFRAIQGIGGGAIIPTAQSLLFARYPRNEHGTAAALFGIGAITAPLLGPTVGGYLIAWSSWHLIFLVNVPIGLVAAVLAFRFIEQPGYRPPKEPVDTLGIVLLATGMGSLQYVIEEGNRDGWFDSHLIVALGSAAIIALVAFVVHELETDKPVVDLRVFANRSYTASTGINLLLGCALFGSSYLFSLYCGAVMRYSALDIGLVFLTGGTVQLLMVPFMGRLARRVDGRYLLAAGILVMSSGLWMNAHLTDSAGFWDLARPQIVRAAGMSLIFMPISIGALSSIPPDRIGNATGIFNLTRELGGSLGLAWMGLIVDRGTKIHGTYLAEQVTVYDPQTQEHLTSLVYGVGNGTFAPANAAEAVLRLKLQTQAMILSFGDGFTRAALVFLVGIVLVALLRRPQAGGRPGMRH